MHKMWKRTDIPDKETVSEWTARHVAQRRWQHSRPFFEAAIRKKDAYIKKRDQEFAYRAARRVTKTWRAVTGKPKDER